MLPFKLVYHERYDLNFGAHIFPAVKYRLIRERLLAEGIARPEDFLEPQPVSREQLLLVHTEEWITKLERGTLSYHEVLRLEAPYSRRMVEAVFLATGGTLLAARQALAAGACINVGGGFHHAFAGHGEGSARSMTLPSPSALSSRRASSEGACGRLQTSTRATGPRRSSAATAMCSPSRSTTSTTTRQ